MREIKFRIWCDGKYHNEDYNMLFKDGSWKIEDWNTKKTKYRYKLDDGVVEQYTGLKDKNGIEIYEGDIVRYVHEQDYHYDEELNGYSDEWIESTISWQNSYPAFDIDGHSEEYNLLSSPEIIIEVIGNIHEKEDE